MGGKQSRPFHFSFKFSLKVDFQGSRITFDAGLLLVRALDERLGLRQLISDNLSDNRRGKNTQLPLPDLLRQSISSRLAGYEDLNDAERLSNDPTFRLIGSEKIRDRGAALPSRLHWFETQVLTQAANRNGLAAMNREPMRFLSEPQSCKRSFALVKAPEIESIRTVKRQVLTTPCHPVLKCASKAMIPIEPRE
jgi:hypothetical protein